MKFFCKIFNFQSKWYFLQNEEIRFPGNFSKDWLKLYPMLMIYLVLNIQRFVMLIFMIGICYGCKPSKQQKTSTSVVKKSRLDSLKQEFSKNGIDFFASGNSPVPWNLQMDFSRSFDFSATGMPMIRAIPVNATPVMDAPAESYICKLKDGNMTIMIFSEKCKDPSSEGIQPKKVYITINNIRYEGCGSYFANQDLNGRWVLSQTFQQELSAAQFKKGIPYLDFNIKSNKLKGFNGCNNFESRMEVQGNRIRFTSFTLTQNTCSTESTKMFTESFNNSMIDYKISGDSLICYLLGDRTLLFRKK
jgi:heat shock protein HslJ/uncharacterized membrane protein